MNIKEPVCLHCKWFIFYPFCVAYPLGIPDDIRKGNNAHDTNVKGDGGIKYEALKKSKQATQ